MEPRRETEAMTNPIVINAIGVAAAICSMASFIPQAAKIIRERDASSVSLRMYVVTVIGFALWSSYGLLLKSWPLVGSNIISLSLASLILALKVRYPDGPTATQASASPKRVV